MDDRSVYTRLIRTSVMFANGICSPCVGRFWREPGKTHQFHLFIPRTRDGDEKGGNIKKNQPDQHKTIINSGTHLYSQPACGVWFLSLANANKALSGVSSTLIARAKKLEQGNVLSLTPPLFLFASRPPFPPTGTPRARS
jgi:hypothetical protein